MFSPFRLQITEVAILYVDSAYKLFPSQNSQSVQHNTYNNAELKDADYAEAKNGYLWLISCYLGLAGPKEGIVGPASEGGEVRP